MSAAGLQVHAVVCSHRFRPGDDLAAHLLMAITEAGLTLEDGDIVCVASKVVALTEGALIGADEVRDATQETGQDEREIVRTLARARAREIVAEAPWVTVTRTAHGFVAANGGIDRSNVPDDGWLELPHDPDASAATLRALIVERTGHDVGVVITDTFGRPWRLGQTDVALGAAGVAVLRDERGTTDLDGRTLGVTISAVGDALAGTADLVRSKASATPFVLVRGLAELTAGGGALPGRGADLVRPLDEDLFRRGAAESVIEGLAARRTVRSLDPDRPVRPALLEEAVAAATTAPAPHGTRPWRFIRLTAPTRMRLLDAMSDAWEATLIEDGLDPDEISGRLTRSAALHRTAPELLAAFVDLAEARRSGDARRDAVERDLFLLSGGAAVEALLVALSARGLGATWTSSSVACPGPVREVLGVPDAWEPLGMVAVGWPAASVAPRSTPSTDGVLEVR
jgi:coenzyme F420-0:L-glutamate ligase/coenzyme F420-1:gamma-L-glutamate ligase